MDTRVIIIGMVYYVIKNVFIGNTVRQITNGDGGSKKQHGEHPLGALERGFLES